MYLARNTKRLIGKQKHTFDAHCWGHWLSWESFHQVKVLLHSFLHAGVVQNVGNGYLVASIGLGSLWFFTAHFFLLESWRQWELRWRRCLEKRGVGMKKSTPNKALVAGCSWYCWWVHQAPVAMVYHLGLHRKLPSIMTCNLKKLKQRHQVRFCFPES